MGKMLIDQTLSGFDTYIRTAILYLLEVEGGVGGQERFKRLGMTQTEMDTAEAYRDQWWTGIVATPGIYELHSNEATKNKTTRRGVERIMEEFTPFFSNLLRRMATLAYTDIDKETLNIPERDAVLTDRGPITNQPIVGVKPLGGGKVSLLTRLEEDSNRASMHPLADAVKIKFKILPPGELPPADADACDRESESTSASFDLDTGSGNAGKIIYGFANYVNITNHDNDGPPSTMFQTMIL